MMNQAVAKRYGQALLEIGQEQNAVDRYQDDLQMVVDTITGSDELNAIWNGKEFDSETKINIVKQLFSGKVADNIVNLLCVVIEKGREEHISDINSMYRIFADEARKIAYAEVVSAYPLTAEQEDAIKGQLARKTGKDVRLNASVDSSLVGGIMVKFGDKVYDGTVAARLEGMRKKLQEVQF